MKIGSHALPPIGGAILECLMGCLNKYHGTYSRISEDHLIQNLKRFHRLEICRTSIWYWKVWLRDNHYIYWYQGRYVDECGRRVYGTCRYYITIKGYKWLKSFYYWGEKVYSHFRVQFSKEDKRPKGKYYAFWCSALGGFSNRKLYEGAPSPLRC
jgi:hypothetical protein